MRDPHVDELIYSLVVGEGVNYQDPLPVSFDTPVAPLQLKGGELMCGMRAHYAPGQEAHNAVQPYLDAWSIRSRLLGHHEFGFRFRCATIIDRNPSTDQAGANMKMLTGADTLFAQGSVKPRSDFDHYPFPPPLDKFEWKPDVQTLWDRFDRVHKGREPLPGAAFFCLTLLEARAAPRPQGSPRPLTTKRKAAAKLYKIDPAVLAKLGELSSERGDPHNSRKADAIPLTPQEGAWLDCVMQKIILRAGCPDASAANQLTMAELPPLS